MGAKEHFFSLGAELDFQYLFERYGELIYRRVDQALEQILLHPESAPVYEGPVRRIVIQGTPIGLFYAIHGERLAVVALLDLRQDPETIRKRLSG